MEVVETEQKAKMKFYVVTIKESTRWPRMEARLKREGLDYEKVEGVSKYSTKTLVDMSKIGCILSRWVRLGQMGCYFSHVLAILKGYLSGAEQFAVFEDDVMFCDNFSKELADCMEDLPEGWKMLLMCSYQMSWDGCYYVGPKQKLIYSNKYSDGMYGYVLNRASAKEILDMNEQLLGHPLSVEGILNPTFDDIAKMHSVTSEFIRFMDRSKCFICFPYLVIEEAQDTLVQASYAVGNHQVYFNSFKKDRHFS